MHYCIDPAPEPGNSFRRIWNTIKESASAKSRPSIDSQTSPLVPVSSFGQIDPAAWELVNLAPPRDFLVALTLNGICPDHLQRNYLSARPAEVLEIGTGTGIMPAILRKSGFDFPMHAIDTDERWIKHASLRQLTNVSFEIADATRIDYAERFDAAFSFMVHHHVPHHQRLLERVFQAIKNGGIFSFADKVNAIDSGTLEALSTASSTQVERLLLTGPPWVKPHPHTLPEWERELTTVVCDVLRAGFTIEYVKAFHDRIIQIVCRKPLIASKEDSCASLARTSL